MPDYSALKNQILSDIQQSPITNTNQKLLMQKINDGSATYEDAATFSKVLGDSASKSINMNIAEGIADSELEQFASECLAPVYRSCQDTMLNAGKSIQSLYNKQAEINLNPVNVKRDESRIEHIVDRFREATSFDDVAFLTGSNVSRSITRGAVTDTVKQNAKFQENVGIDVYISRSDGSGCCDWCSSVCGTFKSFDALPDGFWGIHRGCSCVIDYRVGKTKSRISFKTDEKGYLSKITEENEESNKYRKSLYKDTIINDKYINSNEYRNKLDKIIPDSNERRAVEKASKEIMNHRNGTHFEDLAFINSTSSSRNIIINRDYDYYDAKNHISKCIPNKPMKEMLQNAKDYTIIGVHNHPTGNAPSIADIHAARDRKYKYGVVCCHDGTIYKYSVSSSFKDDFNCQVGLAKLQKSLYDGAEDRRKKAINDLSKLGVSIEVV